MLQTPILQQIVRFFITYTPQICSRASKPNTIYQKFNQSRLEAHYKIEDIVLLVYQKKLGTTNTVLA